MQHEVVFGFGRLVLKHVLSCKTNVEKIRSVGSVLRKFCKQISWQEKLPRQSFGERLVHLLLVTIFASVVQIHVGRFVCCLSFVHIHYD